MLTATVLCSGGGLRAPTNVTGYSAADLQLLIVFGSLSGGIGFSRGLAPCCQHSFFSGQVLNRRGRHEIVVSEMEETWEEMCRQRLVGKGQVLWWLMGAGRGTRT